MYFSRLLIKKEHHAGRTSSRFYNDHADMLETEKRLADNIQKVYTDTLKSLEGEKVNQLTGQVRKFVHIWDFK